MTGSVTGNAATDGGGVLMGNESKMRLSQSASVTDNAATGAGGGVCVYATGSSDATLPVLQLFGNAAITQNTAGTVGGVVLVQAGANLVVAGSVTVDANTSSQSTATGGADNVHLPTTTSATNAAGNVASERVQVVVDPTSNVQGLSESAHVGIYSETEEQAYEQFGEARTLGSDGWYATGTAAGALRTYLHRFYNDRDETLLGTYGVNDEVVWGVGLRVYKRVSGAYANLKKDFDFEFTFSGDSVGAGTISTGSAATQYQVFRAQEDGTYVAETAAPVQLSESDRSVQVKLGDGDYVQFDGMYGDKVLRINEIDSLVSTSGSASSGSPYVVTYDTENAYGSYSTSSFTDVRAHPSSALADRSDWAGRTSVVATNELETVLLTGVLDYVAPWLAVLAVFVVPAARRRRGA